MVPRYLLDALALAYTFTLSAVTVPGTAFSMDGVGVGVAKGDENATLLAAVNATVERVTADGTYDGWVEKACAQNAELLKAQDAAQ